MKAFSSLLAAFTFACSVFCQSGLPEYGRLDDIKGVRTYYVTAANALDRDLMLRELKKLDGYTNSDSAEGADFVIEYKTLSRDTMGVMLGGTGLSLPIETGQIDVYLYRDRKKVVLWSKSDMSGHAGKPGTPARYLAKKFVKDATKVIKEK